MPVAEWMQKEAEGTIPSGDYDVTAIVDERKQPYGKTQEFIVKWKASRYRLIPLNDAHSLRPTSLLPHSFYGTSSHLH